MVLETVQKVFAEQLGISEDMITMETDIAEDLGADSLDVVELIMAMEEEFSLTISDDDAMKFKTIGQVVTYIEKNL